jgi:hypothetical protein
LRTHCPHGHLRSENEVRRKKSRYSYCRACNRESSRRHRERIKATAGSIGEQDAEEEWGKGVAVMDPAKLRPLAKAPGAQFEISIDGTPPTYRDPKEFAIEAAERLKRKHPNSDIVVRDLQSGKATTVKYKPDLGPR